MTDAPETTPPRDEPDADGAGRDRLPDAAAAARYLQWGTLALLVLFALVAAVGLYTSVNRIIEVWVSEAYQPVFSAAFNLFVLLATGAGISLLLTRLAGGRDGE